MNTTIEEVRSQFEYLKYGKTYFNHASTAPLANPVINKINEKINYLSKGPIDDYLMFMETLNEDKMLIGEMLNCKSDRIAFIDNTTNGINILAQSIDWQPGDRILLNNIEFPANVYPFLNLKEAGVEIDFVKSVNGIVSAEDIIEAIKPETRLISISYVQFLTGYRAHLKTIGEYCRDKDILFAVDAIQGLGAFCLDVEKNYIDFISCGTQKWMLGLQGLAFIYVSEKLQKIMKPKFVGWLSVEDAWNLLDFNLELKKSAEAFQNGTINSIGIYALNASLKMLKNFGFKQVTENVLNNSIYFIKKLRDIGIKPFTADLPSKNISGIISFNVSDPDELFEALTENNITASLREGILRFSPHFYNTKEEIDYVVSILKKYVNEYVFDNK